MISPRNAERDSLLFVYGSLRPCSPGPQAAWLAARAHYVGPARTRGRLYDLGRFPGLCAPRSRHEWVSGDVYELPEFALMRALDRYENEPRGRCAAFERIAAIVELDVRAARSRMRVAWLYAYRGCVLRRARIRAGDYCVALSVHHARQT